MSYLKRLGQSASNYDKTPSVAVPSMHAKAFFAGWAAIAAELPTHGVIAVECYPGVDYDLVRTELAAALNVDTVMDSREAHLAAEVIDALVAPFLGGDDPVFGYLNNTLSLRDFFDTAKVSDLCDRIRTSNTEELLLVVGPGASLIAPDADVLVFADMPRWEGQLRQRRNEVDNLGVNNRELKASMQYKRSFFIDWRVADRLKQSTMGRWDYVLDTTIKAEPKMTTGAAHLATLEAVTQTPFRLVPFFDPGPWGGQWMREVCDLPDGPPNYAWCFDCVPEENSILLEFEGGARLEIPSINLVFNQPRRLLGEPVYSRFGPEFPIRFDLLDTMGGGNLSFQVHPSTEFIREHFGMPYTQDESYYILDAEPGAEVYLGAADGTAPDSMITHLEAAQRGEIAFDAERFVGVHPTKKHDHFLIPSGTLHCSGSNSMVLEISATPYIFTFKLWDWERLGLDGLPRPVNLERGKQVINWERDSSYAKAELINQFEGLTSGEGWREERTGLHPTEFIETRRHWFTDTVAHDTGGAKRGSVHVINLVEGEAAIVESPSGAFAPFTVHYSETFVIPAAVGAYTIRPADVCKGRECATLKAFVRQQA
jgi:mannose-6-phosphate isomerase class I